jgi:hypothetical protein
LVFHLLLDGSLKGRPVTDALGVFNDGISLGVIALSFLRLVYCNVVAVASAASTTAVALSRVRPETPVNSATLSRVLPRFRVSLSLHMRDCILWKLSTVSVVGLPTGVAT